MDKNLLRRTRKYFVRHGKVSRRKKSHCRNWDTHKRPEPTRPNRLCNGRRFTHMLINQGLADFRHDTTSTD